jgi:hypothetical protein
MPTKLNPEILVAAIAGFKEEEKRLDTQISELRNMLSPGATDGNPSRGEERTPDVCAGSRVERCRPNGRDGPKARKQAGATSSCPKEAETERRRTKGDHRGP